MTSKASTPADYNIINNRVAVDYHQRVWWMGKADLRLYDGSDLWYFLIILTIFTDLSVDGRARPDAAGPSVFNC